MAAVTRRPDDFPLSNPDLTVADDPGTALLVGNAPGSTANMPVSGSRGGNAALSSLLTQLDAAGIIKNNTSA